MKLHWMMVLVLVLAFPATAALPDTRVIDGDTVVVPRRVVKGLPLLLSVRLIGINTAETKGAKCQAERDAGEAAKVYLRDRIAQAKVVRVKFVRWDKYGGRFDGRITVDGVDLAGEMVRHGYAVPYTGGKRVNVWCPTNG